MQFDNQDRQIKLKIVYYGPALGGKTTCLQYIHGIADRDRRSRLYSLNTASDRTLFFDLLSLELGSIRGYRLTLQLFTVPGQVQYAATRRAVLAGVDGVVLVADSQPHQRQANRQSLADLEENLKANGIEAVGLPMVLQYNKRDLAPVLPLEDLDADLNLGGHPAFATVATTGDGVAAAFAAITERTLEAVAETLGVTNPATLARLREQARQGLAPVLGAVPGDGDQQVVRTAAGAAGEAPLDPVDLISEAVQANVATSELAAELDVVRQRLERTAEALAEAARFAHRMTAVRRPADLPPLLVERSVELLGAAAGSVLLGDASRLQPVALLGIDEDPLQCAGVDLSPVLAEGALVAPQAGDPPEGHASSLAAVEAGGFSSAVLAPLASGGQRLGLLAVYGAVARPPLDDEALRLATLLGSLAAMAWTSAEAWSQLEAARHGLEQEVGARTRQLQAQNAQLEQALAEVRAQEQLQQKLVEQVAAALRGPTTALLTAARVLAGQADAPEDRRARFVGVIQAEAERLVEHVEGLSQAAILGRARARATPQPMAMEDLLRRAVSGLREAAAARAVQLHVLIAAGLSTVWGDPDALVAALRAVIKNAVEFSPAGSDLRVQARRIQQGSTSWLVVRVGDAGPGIPDEERALVFEPFARGSRQPAGRPPTLGLGLTLARRVLASHGGTVRLEPGAAGGTDVTLTLPQPD